MSRALIVVSLALVACGKKDVPPESSTRPKEPTASQPSTEASAIVWQASGQTSLGVALLLRGSPPGQLGQLSIACDGCSLSAERTSTTLVAGSNVTIARAAWKTAKIDPMPTHATLRWQPDAGPAVSREVPIGLMVENAPTPEVAEGPFRPFVRPRAPVAKGLQISIDRVEEAEGMMGPTLRARVSVRNGSSASVQVDRAAFRATIGERRYEAVDNDTPRPLTAWAPGSFYCMRDIDAEHLFPDHAVLRPGETLGGVLCWVGPSPRAPGDATIVYETPEVFRAVVRPSGAFMGVYGAPQNPR